MLSLSGRTESLTGYTMHLRFPVIFMHIFVTAFRRIARGARLNGQPDACCHKCAAVPVVATFSSLPSPRPQLFVGGVN
jgi:hypothetical protein